MVSKDDEDFSFEAIGYWYLTNAQDDILPGTLRVSRDRGALLELIGVFKQHSPLQRARYSAFHSPITILGYTTKGKKITLIKAVLRDTPINTPGITTSRYQGITTLTGCHFESAQAIKFDSMTVHFRYLRNWLELSGLELEDELENGKLTVIYKQVQGFEVYKSNTVSAKITLAGPLYQHSFNEYAKISENAVLSLRATAPLELNKFMILAQRFQDFITLAVGRPSFVERSFGYVANNPWLEQEVEVFEMMPDLPPISRNPKLLFTRRDVEDRLQQLINLTC